MRDDSGRSVPRDPSHSSEAPLERNSAVVLTADPSAAGQVLAGSRVRHVTVLGPEPASWPEPTSPPFDLGVVIGLGTDPAVLAQVLAYLDRSLEQDGVVALSVDPAHPLQPKAAAFTDALAGWCVDGISPVGTEPCVLLRRATSTDPASVREQAALLAGGLAGISARRATPTSDDIELAALRREARARVDTALETAETGTARLVERPASGRPRPGARRQPRLLRTRRTRRAIALAVLVVLAVAVLVGMILGADWWGWLLVAGLVLAVGARQEMWARRQRRRAAKLGRDLASTRAVLQKVVAGTRANATATRTLSARLTAGTAEALDAAASGSSLRDALRPGGVLDVRLRKEFDQVQATVNLFARVDVEGLVPPMRGWAASPDVLNLLVDEFLTRRPSTVIECGSGVSTLWLALAADRHGIDCRIVSLDHDDTYLEQTRRTLERHGVARFVDLRHAPLTSSPLAGHTTPWYDVSALDGVEDAGLAFVDGPPELTGPMARFPALPLLAPHLAPDGVLILDDAARPDESRSVERWVQMHPDFTAHKVAAEKGAVVLRRHPVDGPAEPGTNEKDQTHDD